MKSICMVFVLLLLTACGSVKVYHDYDTQTDFSNYATYNFYPELQTGLSPLDEKRLLDAIDAELQLKGIRFSEDPDFYVNVKTRFFKAPQNTSVGVGLGGGGRNVGGGVSVGIPVGEPNQKREIRFDFVDTQKDLLIWNAVTESSFKENYTPEKRESVLQHIVTKALAKYPPKK